jgi:hypothetical protein
MGEVLRLGGASMAAIAQDGLNQPADKLHVLADRQHWEQTPLADAFKKDRDTADKELGDLAALREGWAKPLDGLSAPAGFTYYDFSTPPDGEKGFYNQTGLTAWVADRFWKTGADFYEDATPKADDKTRKAVEGIGNPLYAKDPDLVPGHWSEWKRAYDEHKAFEWMLGSSDHAGADDARVFLSAGGFPRTAPQPGTPEFRIAVEDMKSRFAACGWRDPLDPDNVLGDITSAAAGEWQQEIASQAAQRNQILDANKPAVDALAKGARRPSVTCWATRRGRRLRHRRRRPGRVQDPQGPGRRGRGSGRGDREGGTGLRGTPHRMLSEQLPRQHRRALDRRQPQGSE